MVPGSACDSPQLHHASSSEGQWKYCCTQVVLGWLIRSRQHAWCVVCLQVHHITGLPPTMEGQAIVVGCEGPPVPASRGAAAFNEVLLHYFSVSGDAPAGTGSFTVWAALADSHRDLGVFPVDLASSNGRALTFVLTGAATGAALTLTLHCRVIEYNRRSATGNSKSKVRGSQSSSCLPDLGCLLNQPEKRTHRGGFITIENSMGADDVDEEMAGFITMEKGTISSGSRRPPSDNLLVTTDDDADTAGVAEDEKPCLLMELAEDNAAAFADADRVQEEFLSMLEERHWASTLEYDLDLESLVKEAEEELAGGEAKLERLWLGDYRSH